MGRLGSRKGLCQAPFPSEARPATPSVPRTPRLGLGITHEARKGARHPPGTTPTKSARPPPIKPQGKLETPAGRLRAPQPPHTSPPIIPVSLGTDAVLVCLLDLIAACASPRPSPHKR